MGGYYDGTKLLSLMDINGNKPEIYICTSNRSAGKTTWFSRFLVKKFLDKGEKFCLIYRYKYELDDCADKFFKDIKGLFFKRLDMTSAKRAQGIYHELFLDDVPCGYAISLNSADMLKKNSHFFNDVDRMFFDEFQSETNHYCANEIMKFISIHTSIARGGGKQSRYLPVYMCSNPVSLLNPYYMELGVSHRLNNKTKFLKGEGFVLEQGFNESASKSQKSSLFNRAFASNKYAAYSAEAIYLDDNLSFVEHVAGRNHYLGTLKYEGCEYAIREYPDDGILYCDDRVDKSYKYKIVVSTNDHQINYVMLKSNSLFLAGIRYAFEQGSFRFKNLKCKEALIKALAY